MALINCYHCSQKSVSSSGTCPNCGLNPQPFNCARCKEELPPHTSGYCVPCARAVADEKQADLVARLGGNCPECNRQVEPELRSVAKHDKNRTLSASNNYRSRQKNISSEHWETNCTECGYLLEWNECPKCHKIYFGKLLKRMEYQRLECPYETIELYDYGCRSCMTFRTKDRTDSFDKGCSYVLGVLTIIALMCFTIFMLRS